MRATTVSQKHSGAQATRELSQGRRKYFPLFVLQEKLICFSERLEQDDEEDIVNNCETICQDSRLW